MKRRPTKTQGRGRQPPALPDVLADFRKDSHRADGREGVMARNEPPSLLERQYDAVPGAFWESAGA